MHERRALGRAGAGNQVDGHRRRGGLRGLARGLRVRALGRPWAASSACSDSMAPWPRDTCWEMATPNEGSVTVPEIVSGRR